MSEHRCSICFVSIKLGNCCDACFAEFTDTYCPNCALNDDACECD